MVLKPPFHFSFRPRPSAPRWEAHGPHKNSGHFCEPYRTVYYTNSIGIVHPFFCILWYAFRFVCFLFQMVGKFVKTFQNRPEKELADATNLPAPFWCFKVMSTYASVFPIPYEKRYTGFLIKKMPEFHKFRHLGTPNWSRTSGLSLRSKTNRFLALLCAPYKSPANPLVSRVCRVLLVD